MEISLSERNNNWKVKEKYANLHINSTIAENANQVAMNVDGDDDDPLWQKCK